MNVSYDERMCARESCVKSFLPKTHNNKYCSQYCMLEEQKARAKARMAADSVTPTAAARYKLALENIAEYVPYSRAQEIAVNALDLEAELIETVPMSYIAVPKERKER